MGEADVETKPSQEGSGEALHDSRWRPVNSCEYADIILCVCGLLIDFECGARNIRVKKLLMSIR